MVDVLEDVITKETGKILKSLPSTSKGLKYTTVYNILEPGDLEVTVKSIATSIRTKMGMMPFDPTRSSAAITRSKYSVPLIEAEMQFNHDDYQLMAKSEYTPESLAKDIKDEMSLDEGALILTASTTKGDAQGIANSNYHTPITSTDHLIANDYDTGIVNLGKMINQLMNTLEGGEKDFIGTKTIRLGMTPDVYQDLAITYDSDKKKTLLQAFDEILKLRLGSTSGIDVLTYLGNTISVNGENGVMEISTTTKQAVLIVVDPMIHSTYASSYDTRKRDYNKVDGYYAKWLRRFLPLVHNKRGIIYDSAVTTN